jgi:hypothetical protein
MAKARPPGARLGWGNREIVGAQCNACAHRVPGPRPACPAFPLGIPAEIQANAFDHRMPHPGEAAPVQFEPREGVPKRQIARLYAALDAIPEAPER